VNSGFNYKKEEDEWIKAFNLRELKYIRKYKYFIVYFLSVDKHRTETIGISQEVPKVEGVQTPSDPNGPP